ncbi:hypothetical protein EIN_524800 [Entamoeba invadens IP1]|uniref:Ubiquitin-like domain-containing protein n=1 Tax=Entamoeba invadens IP1 TaxID=370355 RepID=A0A0A1U5M4_ENTIV|nr:hypothetical protein EIN_524800 [Entamoeba invadens IP1]ELP89555.1 hypothetical protein EIN_524800 [Entamoeba invadens IP1]|eukprot:XP_004256326.1 hypothetical protein EIN_524800 [Entamoeba invadens IP1]
MVCCFSIKRAKQTYYIVVVPSDTIGIVKQRLALVAGCAPELIGILSSDNKTLMSDDTQLGVSVEVGSLFYFLLRTQNGYEPLQIIDLV